MIRAALVDGGHEMLVVLKGAPSFLAEALADDPERQWAVDYVTSYQYWERREMQEHLPALAGNKNFHVTSARLRDYGKLPDRLFELEKAYAVFGGAFYSDRNTWDVMNAHVGNGGDPLAFWPKLLRVNAGHCRARLAPVDFTPLAWEALGVVDDTARAAWCFAAEFVQRRLERKPEYMELPFFPARCVTAPLGEEDEAVAQPDVLEAAITLLVLSLNIEPLSEEALSEARKTRWERTCCRWKQGV